jgi:hypothetical protein
VSYVAGSYARWDFDSFCDGCALSDTIVSLNPAYLTLIKTYKSETNFLYSLTPKVLPGVVAGIKAVFSALAVSHAVSMPHIAAAAAADTTGAALTQLAIQQWADLSILGGASIVDLPLPTSTLASFPVAPELGKYLRAAKKNSMTGFALPEASAVLKFLTEYDPSGIGVLVFLSVNATVGAGMVNSYASTINLTATVTGTHVRVVFPKSRHTVCPYKTDTFLLQSQALLAKGYVDQIARTYGRGAAAAKIGPLLGPASSGVFIARPVSEWLMGYVDPLTSSRYPATHPAHLVRPVTKTFLHDDLGIDNSSTAVDRVPRSVTDKSQWPGLGATRWTLATGADDSSRALDVLESTGGSGATGSGDASEYKYQVGNVSYTEPVRGKYAARAVYRSVKDATAEGNPEVVAWLDFGSSLDFGRAVNLEFAGTSWFAHEDVEVRIGPFPNPTYVCTNTRLTLFFYNHRFTSSAYRATRCCRAR